MKKTMVLSSAKTQVRQRRYHKPLRSGHLPMIQLKLKLPKILPRHAILFLLPKQPTRPMTIETPKLQSNRIGKKRVQPMAVLPRGGTMSKGDMAATEIITTGTMMVMVARVPVVAMATTMAERVKEAVIIVDAIIMAKTVAAMFKASRVATAIAVVIIIATTVGITKIVTGGITIINVHSNNMRNLTRIKSIHSPTIDYITRMTPNSSA